MPPEFEDDGIATASLSHVGRVRSENQDACGEFRNAAGERLLVVADGMGGHRGGAMASQLCVESVAQAFAEEDISIRAVQRVYMAHSSVRHATAPTPKEIYEYAGGSGQGDPQAALRAFGELGEAIGDALANAMMLIDGLVVIGGGLSAAAPLFLPRLVDELNGTIETLDITISDELGSRPYELYSGGETFRINFALRVALARLLARRAGARLQTLIMDEGFGTQDTTGRERLVEAINSVSSDFDLILVVTHVEELKDLFPVRIEVTKTEKGSQFTVL